MKTTIILLAIFAILYGIIQHFSYKNLEGFETSILDGHLGSSNHQNGNTKDQWIKISNINMTSPNLEKTIIVCLFTS